MPAIILSNVVLPVPLAPMTPTIPPAGRLKLRSSISTRPSNDLRTDTASTTRSPSLGPGGMWICLVSLRF